MTSAIKRYSPTFRIDEGCEEDPEGNYVQYDDYAPKWTSEQPTMPGAYWACRSTLRREYRILVHVIGDCPELLVGASDETDGKFLPLDSAYDGYDWCGPLYDPGD